MDPFKYVDMAANAGMGLLLGEANDRRQLNQQEKLNELQIQGQMKMSDYQMKQQYEMWLKTNYPAQIEQMRKAGLNPALMYGMGGGAGGATAQAPASGGGASAETAQASNGSIGMGVQLGLMEAQRKNIEADTKNKEANTAKTAGIDTTKVKAETAAIDQGITNMKAAKELIDVQESLASNELYEKYKTQDWRFEIIAQEVNEAIGRAKTAMAQGHVDEATQNEKIQILKQEAIGKALTNTLIKTQTNKTKSDIQVNSATIEKIKAEINKWAAEITQNWTKINQSERQLKIDAIIKNIEQMYKVGKLGPIPFQQHDKIKIMQMIDSISNNNQ